MRANEEIFDPAAYDKINFIPNLSPSKVLKKNGEAVGM